jgi:hypothetical protein
VGSDDTLFAMIDGTVSFTALRAYPQAVHVLPAAALRPTDVAIHGTTWRHAVGIPR